MFVTDEFDDKRIDILMEHYRNEIIKMQRAKSPISRMKKIVSVDDDNVKIFMPEKIEPNIVDEIEKKEVLVEEKNKNDEIEDENEKIIEKRAIINPTENLSCEIISLEEAQTEKNKNLEKKQVEDTVKVDNTEDAVLSDRNKEHTVNERKNCAENLSCKIISSEKPQTEQEKVAFKLDNSEDAVLYDRNKEHTVNERKNCAENLSCKIISSGKPQTEQEKVAVKLDNSEDVVSYDRNKKHTVDERKNCAENLSCEIISPKELQTEKEEVLEKEKVAVKVNHDPHVVCNDKNKKHKDHEKKNSEEYMSCEIISLEEAQTEKEKALSKGQEKVTVKVDDDPYVVCNDKNKKHKDDEKKNSEEYMSCEIISLEEAQTEKEKALSKGQEKIAVKVDDDPYAVCNDKNKKHKDHEKKNSEEYMSCEIISLEEAQTEKEKALSKGQEKIAVKVDDDPYAVCNDKNKKHKDHEKKNSEEYMSCEIISLEEAQTEKKEVLVKEKDEKKEKNKEEKMIEKRTIINPTENLPCEITSLEEAQTEKEEVLEKEKVAVKVADSVNIVSCDKNEKYSDWEMKNPFLSEYEKNKSKRVVFKKGIGAWGEFKPYEKNKSTKAFFLQNSLEPKNAFMRFSSDIGENEADTTRCQRALALKIFDNINQCDILFNSFPIGFANKSSELFDLFSAMQRNPKTGIFDYNAMWDFVIENPDSIDAMLYFWSDMGTPCSFRSMTFYSCPMIFIDKNGQETAVKFVLSPTSKQKPLSFLEAQELAGTDIDYLLKDLYFTLKNKNRLMMELGAQMIPKNRWEMFDIDIFNPQSLWRISEIPISPLGVLNINRNCENHQKDMAESIFSISNLCEGIKLPKRLIYEDIAKTMGALSRIRTGTPVEFNQWAFEPCEVSGNFKSSFKKCGERLNRMSERESRRLRENLLQSMETLDGEALEKVLLMFTDLDFSFGRGLMNMTEA